MAKTTKSVDELFHNLDQVIEQLENEEISLEKSFDLYQEGMKLLKDCNESIDKVEKKLIVLNEEFNKANE